MKSLNKQKLQFIFKNVYESMFLQATASTYL